MESCTLSIYLGLSVCLFIILFINELNFLDPEIITKPRLTYWSVTHFIIYFIFGILCPNKYFRFLIFGVLWELFEKVYGIYSGQQLYWTSNGIQGQIYDLIMNMLGYYIAHLV